MGKTSYREPFSSHPKIAFFALWQRIMRVVIGRKFNATTIPQRSQFHLITQASLAHDLVPRMLAGKHDDLVLAVALGCWAASRQRESLQDVRSELAQAYS